MWEGFEVWDIVKMRGAGFEPTMDLRPPDLESGALDLSATPADLPKDIA